MLAILWDSFVVWIGLAWLGLAMLDLAWLGLTLLGLAYWAGFSLATLAKLGLASQDLDGLSCPNLARIE